MLRLVILLLTIAGLAQTPAANYSLVAEFERAGELPMGALLYVPSADKFFGTTIGGGAYGKGTIFSVDENGNRTTLVSFSGVNGPAKGEAPSGKLVLGNDGLLYGVTENGGANDCGTIFRVSVAGNLTTLIEFTGVSGAAKGAVPNELVFAGSTLLDATFYGTTRTGGADDNGTVFKLTVPLLIVPPLTVPRVDTLVEFTGTSGTARGSEPVGGLVVNGTFLFGVTTYGGQADYGTVFRYNTALAGTFTYLTQFTGTAGGRPGAYPAAGLVLHSDGLLYGTTELGGTDDEGTVFRVATANTSTAGTAQFTSMASFNYLNGSSPVGALVVGTDQALYGTTSFGGANSAGTIFRISNLGGPITTIASFTGEFGPLPGDEPRAGLAMSPNGDWYGTTAAGGPGNYGTIFKLSPGQIATHVTSLTNDIGWHPAGGVTTLPNGDLYVPLQEGGSSGGGTLVRIKDGGLSVAASFGEALGRVPSGAVVPFGPDLFGFTALGGLNNRGTLYRHIPGGATTTLSNLSISSGAAPEGPLTPGRDGYLYGVARERGASGFGAILRFAPDGSRTTHVSFTGTAGLAKGNKPHAPLALGEDGNFYGVTELGGVSNRGTLFRMTPDGTITTLHEFGPAGPGKPAAGLVQTASGDFFGTTTEGGAANLGTIFRCTPEGAPAMVSEFLGPNGATPGAPLLEALDGTLYGTTIAGGSAGYGTVFKVSPTGVVDAFLHFTGPAGGAPGGQPVGALAYGEDGMIYGTVSTGGAQGGGGVFRITAFGPHAVTDPPTFQLALSTLHGRAQTGGHLTTYTFEYGFTPDLLLPVVALPTNASEVRGVITFSFPMPSLLPGQTVYYRAVASTLNGSATGQIRSFTALSPLAGWKLNLLGNSNAGDLEDPDLDGLMNLLEYALLRDPKAPDPGSVTVTRNTGPGGDRLVLTVQRDPERNDVTLAVEAAPSLNGPWSAIAVSQNGGPFAGTASITGDSDAPGIKTVSIRDTVPITAAQQRYLRLRVSH